MGSGAEFQHARPTLGEWVHYAAHGSGDGTHPKVCRAAVVTGTGAWMETAAIRNNWAPGEPPTHGATRTLMQRWDDYAASLLVHNPNGQYTPLCEFDPGRAGDDPFRGGTWHRPGTGCRPGGTR